MEQDATRGGDAFPPMDKGAIEQIREGMKVVDAAGEALGKVEIVKMGDPQVVTTEGQAPPERGGLVRDFAAAFGFEAEPRIPPALAERMMRTGFIKIDGKGWIDTDRYVPADQIAGVSADTVRLSVSKTDLVEEA